MKTNPKTSNNPRSGSILTVAVVLLAIAGIALGAIIKATFTYRANTEAHARREKAAFLADAGLHAAIMRMNEVADGNITLAESKELFTSPNLPAGQNWGFETKVSVTNNRFFVESIGEYANKTVSVGSEMSLGAGKRSIHALYAHAMFAGNSSGSTNYTMEFGGTGTGADYVKGDVYSGGNVSRAGGADLRLPEAFINDWNNDGICDLGTDTWVNAYASQVFDRPLTQAEYNDYVASQAANAGKFYSNGKYDKGEAFVDTIGNGVYDEGEPFTDSNSNGKWDPGDSFIDRNGNGVYDAGVDTVVDKGNGKWDPGEQWTEDNDSVRKTYRQNGRYDPAGGYYDKSDGYKWKTSYKSGKKTYYCTDWPAEVFEDLGDGVYQPPEPFIDQNGVYDVGEQFFDDRNNTYDYGTQAVGSTSGMPSPGTGQRAANGGDSVIHPPDLQRMYFNLERKNATKPADALARWGSDVIVKASDYGNNKCITSTSDPRHIFLCNPGTSGSVNNNGKTIYGRSYTKIKDNNNKTIDDFFLEDAADVTFNTEPTTVTIGGQNVNNRIAKNDSNYTCTMRINVTPEHNMLTYYVDGNLYLHSPKVHSMRFRNEGTHITIVAKGNITISDEFFYNADYDPNLEYSQMNSSVVINPKDTLCLIALKNPDCSNSGNIRIGDTAYGTGGSIHAMLYAENDFIDANLDTADQQYISIFGNMSAGNQIRVNRATGAGKYRTRLDVTLDERIRNGTVVAPGMPHPVGTDRSIQLDTAWRLIAGTWHTWDPFQ